MLDPSREPTNRTTVGGLVVTARPHQWYKQGVLFLPLVYSGLASSPAAWGRVTVAAVLFSLVASCVYIGNDVLDRAEDRRHPVKRHRPIASGEVSVRTAVVVSVVGLTLAGVSAAALDVQFAVVVGGYVLQNTAYSTVLKDLFLVDMLVIAVGFVLRALGGVAVINVWLSPWLLLTVFLAAFLLASGKRRAELVAADIDETRPSLDETTETFSRFTLFLAAATLTVVYSLYTFFGEGRAMMLTIPFAYYSVLRFSHLVLVQPTERVHRLLFRRDMLTNFAVWGAVTVAIIYRPFP